MMIGMYTRSCSGTGPAQIIARSAAGVVQKGHRRSLPQVEVVGHDI